MNLSIQHNLAAMNANRMLGVNTGAKAKSTEKLSSGYKVNRAADDAAGLSISEKMRRQIRGLRQGTFNVQDGISFVQVADGYLHEVHDMVQRLNELAVKGANGTLSPDDRSYLDREASQLKEETRRIFKTAEFNGIKIFHMPYIPEVEAPATNDIRIFNSGMDAGGKPMFGGIEVNDVRHTWEELGISLSPDGSTFTESKTVTFNDYTGERVSINVKKGDLVPQMSRNYDWSADETGVYVNNVFASTWENMGVNKNGTNSGEKSFVFHDIPISFTVEDGDTLQDIIDGMNGRNLGTKPTFDLAVSHTQTKTALLPTEPITRVKATNANKNEIDAVYGTGADETGVWLTDGAGNAYSKMGWSQFTNIKTGIRPDHNNNTSYPISDWGTSDSDGKGLSSDKVTFDKDAVYQYKGNITPALQLSFCFEMMDETGLEAAIAGLNGGTFQGGASGDTVMRAPGRFTAGTAGTGSPQVTVSNTNVGFELQRALGRNFDDSAATLTGSITRTKVTDSVEPPVTRYRTPASPVTESAATREDTSAGDVYVTTDNIHFYKVNELESFTRTSRREEITTTVSNVHYEYSGTFAGQTLYFNDSATASSTTGFSHQKEQTDRAVQEKEERVRRVTDFDSSTVLTGSNTLPSGAEVITVSSLQTGAEEVTMTHDYQTVETTTTYSTPTRSDNLTLYTKDSVSLGKGAMARLSFSTNAGQNDSDTTNLTWQASDFATRSLTIGIPTAGNTAASASLSTVIIHNMRELVILAGPESHNTIDMRWSPLSNGILGISGLNLSTAESSLAAIGQAKYALEVVSRERSGFGAYQNRLEHTVRNNENIEENTTAAESRIRDTDMAKEMVRQSLLNVLEQSGHSMLSNANQSKQGILSMLQ